MDEHIRIGLMYPRVKLNTTYSFGIDDQEFVVAFETNFPEDFLDLVQQLRETEISMYTLQDTPIFSCVRVPAMEMLDRLGMSERASQRSVSKPAVKKRAPRQNAVAESNFAWAGRGDSGVPLREDVSRGGLCVEPPERVGADGGDDSLGAVH